MNPPGTATATALPVRGVASDPLPPSVEGALLFSRYAYPPNELGYCGPDDHAALLEYSATGLVDPGLAQLARGFAGAWPYLELIAAATGAGHPLDRRVVEAYWLGSSLLHRIDMTAFGNSLFDRFRARAGSGWSSMAEAIPVGALPTHSFHVFGVYPWVGLLRGDRSEQPLHVLERCRIRWGKVLSVEGDQAVVVSRPLTWDGRQLALGGHRTEVVNLGAGGLELAPHVEPGDWVAMHWGWICDRLSRRQLANLRRYTLLQLDVTNHRVSRPGAAVVLS